MYFTIVCIREKYIIKVEYIRYKIYNKSGLYKIQNIKRLWKKIRGKDEASLCGIRRGKEWDGKCRLMRENILKKYFSQPFQPKMGISQTYYQTRIKWAREGQRESLWLSLAFLHCLSFWSLWNMGFCLKWHLVLQLRKTNAIL